MRKTILFISFLSLAISLCNRPKSVILVRDSSADRWSPLIEVANLAKEKLGRQSDTIRLDTVLNTPHGSVHLTATLALIGEPIEEITLVTRSMIADSVRIVEYDLSRYGDGWQLDGSTPEATDDSFSAIVLRLIEKAAEEKRRRNQLRLV